MDVNVTPFEIETKTRHGDMVRADVYLPRHTAGPFPALLGASPYQKSLRYLPPVPTTFPFIEYGPMQLYLDEGYDTGHGPIRRGVGPRFAHRGRGDSRHDRTCGGPRLVDWQDRHDRDVTLLLEPVERSADAAGAFDVPLRL